MREADARMAGEAQLAFGTFRFDPRSGQLWCDGREVRLTPRAAAVLYTLAERGGDVVSKQELFDRVWNGIAVTDDALTSCIQELRGALGDDARRPRYIETRHRRGYRFMLAPTATAEKAAAVAPMPARLVGRAGELGELARAFDAARSGHRQVVFVTGEPGIGKSSLADAFLEGLRGAGSARIAHGQCVDHHGVGEPYLPLIEALTRLARAVDGAAVKDILASAAPSWLAQMPSLWTRAERSVLEARSRATRERMMRELTDAVEAIAAETPLVLKLEDVHWSDGSTLDWLAHMARRPEPARLMVVATFRPADAAAGRSGLDRVVAELAVHRWCAEVALAPLGLDAIETFLAARLGAGDEAARAHEIAPLLLERTGGNPLFMTGIVNELARRDAGERTLQAIGAIPHDVRRFIDRQIDALAPADRDLLMAASVIGRSFATAAVAPALESDVEAVEAACARLVRQGVFIDVARSIGWPDGTRTELHSFRHDLYRELLYDRLTATRRAQAHARVGHRLESAWAGRLDAIAAELAEHFERGHAPVRAIPHHQRAAAKALRRSANEEAIGHLRRALDVINTISDEGERTRTEVELLIGLGAAFVAKRGFGAPEVLDAYARAEALCERLGEQAEIVFPALWGNWLLRWGRSEVDVAWSLCERLLAMAARSENIGLKLQAHHAAWATSFGRGELAEVHVHAQAGLKLYDARLHQAMASSYGNHDAGTCARNFSAIAFALAGEEERARAMADESLMVAGGLNDPFSLALTLFFTAVTAQVLCDLPLAAERAKAGRALARDHALALPEAWSMGVLGWCTAQSGDTEPGILMMNEAIAVLDATQSRHFESYLLALLADAQMGAGNHSAAMRAVVRGFALASQNGERYFVAGLHRLEGELLARPPHADRRKAEASFRTAIEIACRQRAVTLQSQAEASFARWCG